MGRCLTRLNEGTVQFRNSTEVGYAGTDGSRCKVRSLQILNVSFHTAILVQLYYLTK